jgi:hypothetical protein
MILSENRLPLFADHALIRAYIAVDANLRKPRLLLAGLPKPRRRIALEKPKFGRFTA